MTRSLAVLLVFGSLLVTAPALDARPGGGDTYSRGRSVESRSTDTFRSSSRSRDDDRDRRSNGGDELLAVIAVLEFAWRFPVIGVPMILLVLGALAFLVWSGGPDRDWDSTRMVLHPGTAEPDRPPPAPPPPIDPLTAVDPDFSFVLFEDFAYRLYAAAQESRGEAGRLDELAPYVGPSAREALASRAPVGAPVRGVVVGAMRVLTIDVPAADAATLPESAVTRIELEFEANYTVGAEGRDKRYARERWTLQRALSARTRPPSAARRFPCPNCGAPWRSADASGTQKCASCGSIVDNGRFDWQVTGIQLVEERNDLPRLDEDTPESETLFPTVREAAFADQWRAFGGRDAAAAAAIDARLRHIYRLVNDAWNSLDLELARPVLSDGMADYLRYWLDAYESQGLRNVLGDMRLARQTPVKLRRDRSYDALTIRIWATGKDYVVRTSDGSHVRGSREQNRGYSEYWTLIRSARLFDAAGARTCPSCGAPLTISMAGACSHCGTYVAATEFDWVLSKIEQDESYAG